MIDPANRLVSALADRHRIEQGLARGGTKYGSEHTVKEASHLQIEGKNSVVADGDILHIRIAV